MRLGIAIEETWDFFHEIYADLQARHETTLFTRRKSPFNVARTRIEGLLFRRDMAAFLAAHEVVFFEWASQLLAAATHFPKRCGIVTRLHRYELYDWADRINWDAVDRVILVSRAKEQEFRARFPDQAQKTFVSSPSTSLERFSYRAKPFSGDIGILCHLTPRKRVYDTVLAFYELAQQDDRLHLHIGGGPHVAHGDYYTALLHLIESTGLADRVTLYGHVKETWDWYHKIDIFLSNSYSEGLQVAPMEAMASGCFCLSHRWHGAEELVPAENLFLTTREMQEKILAFCALPESEKQAQRAAMRQLACERFDIRKTIAEIGQVIEDVAAGRHTA
ncbi:MAG: glycosyltransferase family 4 protein [Caldilineaceae bacterium]|nr:glycosyltransferase family 4 protein [Caldilineaceae bacterium]